eukprot:2981991-Amphidinium_carterae.2
MYTFAGNALITVNGSSPYVAVLGRQPALLPDIANDAGDGDVSEHSTAVHRLREVALQSMIEHTARERIRRAKAAHTRPSGEQMELVLGQEVDYFRQDATAGREVSSWRGPATVIDLTRLTHGRVGLRTSSDRVIAVRAGDVRPRLVYWLNQQPAYHPAVHRP